MAKVKNLGARMGIRGHRNRTTIFDSIGRSKQMKNSAQLLGILRPLLRRGVGSWACTIAKDPEERIGPLRKWS